MSDSYVHVSQRGLGGNLVDSIKSLIAGILLFIVSFPILWWNEGRTDMSLVANTSIPVGPAAVDPKGEGKLVSVTGDLETAEQLADPQFLKPRPCVQLERRVEMFAWVEHVEKETKKKLGGGSETITTYTYTTEWTASPREASRFEHPEGHENPRLPLEAKTFTARHAGVGAYSFDPRGAELPGASRLGLEAGMLTIGAGDGAEDPAPPDEPAAAAPKKGKHHRPKPAPATLAKHHRPAPEWRLAGGYLFRGPGEPDQPRVGAVRVSFAALDPGQQVTLFGEQHGAKVGPYLHAGKDKLYRVVLGSRAQAIQHLHAEHVMITWLLRGLGFLLMWIGLGMFFAPINAVLDVLPFLGSIGRFVTGLIMFPVALVLTALTILLSIIAHSTILLIVTLVVIVGGLTAFIVLRGRKKGAAAAG